jgi:hypothetical protein
MPLPANWNSVNVAAKFLQPPTGSPAAGSVLFTAQRAVGMDDTAMLPVPISVALNVDGEIAASLPCPDDAAAGFTSLVYRVDERIQFARTYYVQVDNAMSDVDLFDLPQLTAPAALEAAYGRIVVLTAAEYAALNPPDPNTIYAVTA